MKKDKIISSSKKYSVEFFHIYTDEKINDSHQASLNYLNEALKAWNFDHSLIVLIDNYNPTTHTLSHEEIIEYLGTNGFNEIYYAFEADMASNAQKVLDAMTSNKLYKNYKNYINKKEKYPCSLLTATWYLTRLGVFNAQGKIYTTNGVSFTPADRLLNILPLNYKGVEERALKIIRNSPWAEKADVIQDLFYPDGSHRKIELF